MNWIKSSEELPEKDGLYEITNYPNIENDKEIGFHFGVAEYDGYGFKYENIYRRPLYWRAIIPLQKRYGKLNTKTDTNHSAAETSVEDCH